MTEQDELTLDEMIRQADKRIQESSRVLARYKNYERELAYRRLTYEKQTGESML